MIDKSNFIEITFPAEAWAEVIAVIRPACVVAEQTRLWVQGLFLRSETEAGNFGLNIWPQMSSHHGGSHLGRRGSVQAKDLASLVG